MIWNYSSRHDRTWHDIIDLWQYLIVSEVTLYDNNSRSTGYDSSEFGSKWHAFCKIIIDVRYDMILHDKNSTWYDSTRHGRKLHDFMIYVTWHDSMTFYSSW